MDFTRINLHAILNDTTLFPRACIYMQLDAARDACNGAAPAEDDEDGAPEVRLAPTDADSCALVFYI